MKQQKKVTVKVNNSQLVYPRIIVPCAPSGVWGSAFTILFQRLLGEEEPAQRSAEKLQGIHSGDLRMELSMY